MPPKSAEILRLALQEHGAAFVRDRLGVTDNEVDAWLAGIRTMPQDTYIALVELRHEDRQR